jgi:uncharacterized protein YigA (DUF484 family)
MALNDEEEKRIQRIELALGQHTTAIKNLASKRQLTHLLSLVERQLKEVRDDITSLKAQIETLKK